MKKILIWLMVIAIFAGTTGCGNSSADPTEDPTAEASISSDTSSDGADDEEMSSETESSQQSETPGESTDPERSVSSSSNTSSPGSTPGTGNQGTPGTNSGNRSANGGNSQSSSSSTPSTPAPTAPSTSAPTTPSTPAPTTPSTPAPTDPPPAPKTAYDYPFDPEQIKQDMIAYGKSLGMKKGSASSSTGDITASSSFQGTALKNALMNRVAWYANPDNLAAYGGDPVEYFNVTYSGSDGNYSFVFWY